MTLAGDRFVRHPAAIWRCTADVLVATRRGAEVWQGDRSAAAVWRTLDVPRLLDEVVERVAPEGADRVQVSSDVAVFLDNMERRGLVVRS